MKNTPLLLSHTSELFSLWYHKELAIRAADKIKRKYFADRRYLGSKDRRFIEELFFNMIRNLRLYNWQIENTSTQKITPELLTVHAYKRLYPETHQNVVFKIKDTLATCFEDHHYQDIYPDELDIRWSMPSLVWEHIKHHYQSEELNDCLPAMLESPGVHLRTNILKVTTPELMQKIEDLPFKLGTLSPEALRLEKYSNLNQHPAFKHGLFDLQDESSQLVAYVCNPRKNDLVIDLCAGAGGKTMHLAALQGDSSSLIATDKYPDRLKELIIRAKRLGVRNIKLTPIKQVREKYKAKADILLIDAPCSGSGVYGRHPDRKWELTDSRLDFYTNEQRHILENNHDLVKVGGYLIYATCSIIPDENHLQVENFLQKHSNFKAVSVFEDLQKHAIRINHTKEKYLQILPHHYQSDGFFIAKIKRMD